MIIFLFKISIDDIAEPIKRADNLTINISRNFDSVKDNDFTNDLIMQSDLIM